jgi:hypothetical protein
MVATLPRRPTKATSVTVAARSLWVSKPVVGVELLSGLKMSI